jgi:hypothetical protein
MRRTMLALAAMAALALPAFAGGGGKIKFREGKTHDAALAEAKATGTPLMLYFTADF